MAKIYSIEILNASLEKIAEVLNPYPLGRSGSILKFSNELSQYGTCTFRVSSRDSIIAQHGDILIPHKYHVRIKRRGAVVWQGAIVDNSSRNKNFIEVVAAEYLFYFDKKRIKRDVVTPETDPLNNYRTFKTGTMASAVNSVLTEMLATLGDGHILKNMTIGTIENPDYPSNFTDSTGKTLTGGWNFSDNVIMQFDYHTVLHALRSFGAVSSADFELTNSLVFNFKKFLGTKRLNIGFNYGTFGNILNYNVPRYGTRMQNDIYGLATDDKGNLLRVNETDSTSISEYGSMEGSTAFSDVINNNVLRARLKEDLSYLKDPESAPVNLELDDKTYPLGTWKVGDVVNVKINDSLIDFNAPRRIVGITTIVHDTGKEIVTVQTNKPRDADLAS